VRRLRLTEFHPPFGPFNLRSFSQKHVEAYLHPACCKCAGGRGGPRSRHQESNACTCGFNTAPNVYDKQSAPGPQSDPARHISPHRTKAVLISRRPQRRHTLEGRIL
jgi:hypothetical protein